MKKKVVSIILLSFMLCGVVSAASLWGNYKGNAIVKVNVDGKQYKTTGVPSILYNGQVLLPLNVLKQLGVTYSYDSKKLTANISKPVQPEPVDEAAIREAPISWMKLYYSVANEYKNINDLLYQMDIQLFLTQHAMSYVIADAPADIAKSILDLSANGVKNIENTYGTLDPRIPDTVKWGAENDLDMRKMEEAYEKLDKIKGLIKDIHSSADSYYKSGKNKNYYDDYMYQVDKASQEITSGKAIAFEEYEKYYRLIQDYK